MLLELLYLCNLFIVAAVVALLFVRPAWLGAKHLGAEVGNAVIMLALPIFALAYETMVGENKVAPGLEVVYYGTGAVVAYLTYRQNLFLANKIAAAVVGIACFVLAVAVLQWHFTTDEFLRYGVYFALYAALSGLFAYLSRRAAE